MEGLGLGLGFFYFILDSPPLTRDVTCSRLHLHGKIMRRKCQISTILDRLREKNLRRLPTFVINQKHSLGWFLLIRVVDLVRVCSLHIISRNHSNMFLLINLQNRLVQSETLQYRLFVLISRF